MCHLTGIILGKKRRKASEREMLVSIFRDVLVASGPLGPHATGAGWVNRDGEFAIFKAPVRAEELVGMSEFDELVSSVDNTTTVLLGHARYRTRGDERNNSNNHPLFGNGILGTLRGTILNADELFPKFRLKRTAQVDSELLVRLAAITGRLGPIDTKRFLAGLRHCRGQISGVLVSVKDPETILILKGDSPLEFRWNDKLRAVAYASNGALLDAAVGEDPSWKPLEIPPMTLAVFRVGAVQSPKLEHLEFSAGGTAGRKVRSEDHATYGFDRWTPPWKIIPGRTQNGQTA